MDRKEAGDAAESAALTQLQQHGLKLVSRNYRCRMGEIDLVMLEDKTLVLIEVRYRSLQRFGGAAASVDMRKQKRFIAAAKHLLVSRTDLRLYPVRFDVVAVSPGSTRMQCDWIKDAFRL